MNGATGSIAVVIAARNEAERLPLLLADLNQSRLALAEVVVVDGGSSDATALAARLAGAHVVRGAPCRGGQMAQGAAVSQADWLLFLHGDGRLPAGWDRSVAQAMGQASGKGMLPCAWYFWLAIDGPSPTLRLVELAANLRSLLRQLPYGDQGLLLSRELYQRSGGFAALPLMEDLDFVQRLRQYTRLRSLGLPLRVNGRRWIERGVWAVGWSNWLLRRSWRRGVNCQELASRYYDQAKSTFD